MGRVDVRSDIPEQHPHKRGVEEVFREVLGSAGGSWTVVIYLIHGIFWTVFVIRDSDGFRRVLLVDDPREQQPEFFASSLRALVEEARFWRAADPVPDFPGSPCAISPQGSRAFAEVVVTPTMLQGAVRPGASSRGGLPPEGAR